MRSAQTIGDDHSSWDENEQPVRRSRFRGHWAGIELGLNNYATSTNSMVLPDDIDFMTLHSGKSTNFNINFSQLSIGLSQVLTCTHLKSE